MLSLKTVEWKDSRITLNATIKDAIKSLNESGTQIILVVDTNEKFLGTISDGDLRRGFISGLNLTTEISTVYNPTPITASSNDSESEILRLMNIHGVRQIPVVGANGNIEKLCLLNQYAKPQSIDNALVIMAGGKGTRLLPYTENTPKPMLEISGKPIIQHIIENATKQGITNFFVSIHHLGSVIRKFLGDGAQFGARITYIEENQPLGTAGALTLMEVSDKQPFLVVNGDVVSSIDYKTLLEFHKQQNAMGTMATKLYEWQHPFGVVQTSRFEITEYQEKPLMQSLINAGIYVLDPSALKLMVRDEYCDMPELFTAIRNADQKTVAFPLYEGWIDVGRIDDFRMANIAAMNNT